MHDHSIWLLSDLSFPAFRGIPVWNVSSALWFRAPGFRIVSFVMNKLIRAHINIDMVLNMTFIYVILHKMGQSSQIWNISKCFIF